MAEIRYKESPFSPGKPVPIEYFVARLKEIQRLERAIQQTYAGKNENIFIAGERGIGKSSLAAFIRYLAEKKYDFIGTHCYLGGVKDMEGMIGIICQRLLQESTDKTIFDELSNILGKYIKQVGLFGISVEFTREKSELRMLLDNFLPLIRKIYESIKKQKKGIVLILDDLNGITQNPEFAHFLKSFVDELATSQKPLPLLLILVGVSDRRKELGKHQSSIARIFDVIELSPMAEREACDFFKKTYGSQNIFIPDGILRYIARLSGGLPVFMHEIGDAIFWEDTDDSIDNDDAMKGIRQATENIGKKYLESQIYQAIRSETYHNILQKIGKLPVETDFLRKEIREKMAESERKGFDNFIRKIKKLGLITEGENRGEYRFVNQLFHLYVRLVGSRKELVEERLQESYEKSS